MTHIEVRAQVDIDRPAGAAWALVADYGRDPSWRAGVESMQPEPAGPVHPGQATRERIRFAGRTLRNDGVVTAVDPGRRFAWRTTSGVDADGSRAVEALGADRCRVVLELRVRPRGGERLLAPVTRMLLRRGLARDAGRLRALVESAAVTARAGTGTD